MLGQFKVKAKLKFDCAHILNKPKFNEMKTTNKFLFSILNKPKFNEI